jgi:carboxymethylenebutenolidase
MAASLVVVLGAVLSCSQPIRPTGSQLPGPAGARRARTPQMPPSVGRPLGADVAGDDEGEVDWPEDDPAYQPAPLHTEELIFAGGGGRPARAYLAAHKATMRESRKGIVILSDIFGYAHPNTRAAAERLAASCEAFVLVPDFFRGGAWPEDTPPTGPAYEAWRARYPLQELAGDLDGCAHYLNSVHGVELLGLAGFCWGGGRALELLAREWVDAHAVVVFYPTRFDVEPVARALSVPLLAVYGGADTTPGATQTDAAGLESGLACNPRMRQQYFVRSFPGRPHAFAHLPLDDEGALSDADAALKLAEAWFDKYMHDSLLPATTAEKSAEN